MRRLCKAGIYGRITIKKAVLRKQNNIKTLQCAKTQKDWLTEQWNKVLWKDDKNFKILGWNRRVYVWRSVGKRAATPFITPTVKNRGGSVIVLGTFANCKIRDLHQMKGKLNQTSYHSILQNHAIPSVTQLVGRQGFAHMQDNDPRHTSKL